VERSSPLVFLGFIVMLLTVVVSSYLYFFHFESFIGYIAGVPASSLAQDSPTFSDAWGKIIPYKIPLLLSEAAMSFLLVIYAFAAPLRSSIFIKTAKVFSILFFLFYLLIICLAPFIPYGGIIG
jgi:hypothetical protein